MMPQRIIMTVLACHFVAAFGALGMPPFLGLILQDLAPSAAPQVTGLFYILPTAAMALSSPLWGVIADRWGRKRSLMRAQLGLAASFLIAGLADDMRVLAIALCLQGLLGGTFAASNAYLARALPRNDLARGLNLTQATARLALVAAPLTIGILVDGGWRAQHVYLLLAALPLLAFCLIIGLPTDDDDRVVADVSTNDPTAERHDVAAITVSVPLVMACQAGFTVILVASFPFTISLAIRGLGVEAGLAGWLFGLPHIVYLIACVPFGRRMEADHAPRWFSLGCVMLAASMPLQVLTGSIEIMAVGRLLMGIGMTLGYLALNAMIAGSVRASGAGRLFGWFDGVAKAATVFAGIAAGQIVTVLGVPAVFIGSALLALPVALLPVSTPGFRLRPTTGS